MKNSSILLRFEIQAAVEQTRDMRFLDCQVVRFIVSYKQAFNQYIGDFQCLLPTPAPALAARSQEGNHIGGHLQAIL